MKLRSWCIALAAVGLVACGEEQGERVELGEPAEQTVREDARANWSPELTARIDSANAAYADGDYDTAATMFTGITEENPELGVAWFGLYMAEQARGNTEAAEAALARAEQYAPGLGRMHEAATDTTMKVPMIMEGHPQVPAGHPPLDSGSQEDAPPLPETTGGQ